MFGLNSEEFLSQVQERVEQSKSNYFLIQRRAKFGIVAIETIGSASNQRVFERCSLSSSGQDGQILFSPGSKSLWIANRNARFDESRSEWQGSNQDVWIIKVWSLPNEKSLPKIHKDQCMTPSSIVNSQVNKTDFVVRLAEFVQRKSPNLSITLKSFKYDHQYKETTCFVHGINSRPEAALCSILHSVRGVNTCCIHSLAEAEGAWKGKYALRLSPSVIDIEDSLD